MSASDDNSGTGRPLRDGIDTVKSQVGDVAHSAIDKTRDSVGQAREALTDAYGSGRDTAADAFASGRDKASETLSTARDRLRTASADLTDGLEASPLVAIAGGIAVGVLVGALLPRSARETGLYGAVGQRITAAARDAAEAAKDAGREKLADMGISRDHAGDTVRTILEAALAAATSAGGAAIDNARKSAGEAA